MAEPVTMPTFNTQAPVPTQGAIPTYPAPYGSVQQGSTGGLVNKAGIVAAGIQNGVNLSQQITKNQRDAQAYKEQQDKNKGNTGFVDANPDNHNTYTDGTGPAPASGAHADFMSSVLQGLHSLGSGVQRIFGGGGIPAPAAPAAPAAQPPPADNGVTQAAPPPAQTGLPPNPALAQVVPGQMAGGPVTKPEFMLPQPSPTIVAFEKGGVIPAGGMGVVQGGVQGIPGFETGGAIPDPAAAVQAGAANGTAESAQVNQNVQQQAQYGATQSANQARAAMIDEIDKFHDSHDKASLDDDGNVKGAQPVAAPPAGIAAPGDPQSQATSAAVTDAATNPEATSGKVATTPSDQGKPKSITPEQWDAWEQSKYRAAHYAALAGEDPNTVLNSLTATQNGFIQGHVLRYLAAANVAQQTGDQKGVEQALKNAYYYMPDGKELQIKKDSSGNLIYQDPINPTDKDGKPNMIPVDAAHIQALGQAMLDPMNVQTTINNVRMAHATMMKELQQGQAALLTGQGTLARGRGVEAEGQASLARVNADNYNKVALGDAARMKAVAISNHLNNLATKIPNMDPTRLKLANDASDQFDKQAAGEVGTVPLQVPDTRPGHQGEMTANTDPNAGKPFRDPSKIPAELKNLTPSQILEGRAVAGEIALANPQNSPAEATRLAALYAAGKTSPPKNTPKGPDGKPMANVHTDPKTGDTWVWNPAMKKWETFKLTPQSAQTVAGGGSIDPVAGAELASNDSGAGGIPQGPSADMQAARTEADPTPAAS